ncbi:MAG TPA: hypothetical protein VNO70_25760 [Blastocatellia bacterium]|nr:hypothetical protein [Blastocatellia bacterium]
MSKFNFAIFILFFFVASTSAAAQSQSDDCHVYTDESMASLSGSNSSMLVGIVISDKAQRDAIVASDNAVAEVTDEHIEAVRVKRFMTISGRRYLVGLECRREKNKK